MLACRAAGRPGPLPEQTQLPAVPLDLRFPAPRIARHALAAQHAPAAALGLNKQEACACTTPEKALPPALAARLRPNGGSSTRGMSWRGPGSGGSHAAARQRGGNCRVCLRCAAIEAAQPRQRLWGRQAARMRHALSPTMPGVSAGCGRCVRNGRQPCRRRAAVLHAPPTCPSATSACARGRVLVPRSSPSTRESPCPPRKARLGFRPVRRELKAPPGKPRTRISPSLTARCSAAAAGTAAGAGAGAVPPPSAAAAMESAVRAACRLQGLQ